MCLDKLKSKIPYLKKCEKYALFLLITVIILIIFSSFSTNSTSYIQFYGFKIYDFGATVALFVGILAFFATLYNTDKNYKAMKLSSMPEKSANLLIDLKFVFNKYESCKQKNSEDEFKLLATILKYWKDHQKAFTLLTPHFYKEFLKIITTEYNFNNEIETPTKIKPDYSKTNSNYILKALISQITNIALKNDECYFEFIKPELIEDKIDIEELGENIDNYTRIKINKFELEEYIKQIKGISTQELTDDEFKKLNKKIKKLLNDLRREIEEYG